MLMGKLLTAEFGPGIIGVRNEINGSMVCIATPTVLSDPSVRRAMRELVRRQGGDCGGCRGCPVGQRSS